MTDIKVVVDCTTGEVSEEALTPEDQAQRTKDTKAVKDARVVAAQAEQERASKVDALKAKLKLTDEEMALLRG